MIDQKVVKNIKIFVNSKEEDGWLFRCYGTNPIAVLIGESHNMTDEELDLQNTILGWIKPGYVLSERCASNVKSQMLSMDKSIAENACFFGYIGSDEEKQGNIIENCSEVVSRPVAAILGGCHVRENSGIHKTLNGHIDYICVWNERNVEKKRKEKKENKSDIKSVMNSVHKLGS